MALVGLLWGVTIHNHFVHLRAEIDRAWANVDVLLLQRADEVPSLVEVCRGYARHEREVLEAVARARTALQTSAGPAARSVAQESLNGALSHLYAVAEASPQLRADAVFAKLQRRLTAIEDEIADRREHFNACVTRYNTRLAELPDAVVARLGGQRPLPLFTAAAHAPRALPRAAASPPGPHPLEVSPGTSARRR